MSQYKGLTPIEIAEKIEARHKKWGKIGASTVAVGEVEEVVVHLLEIIRSYDGGLTKDEATKLRRQLAAANARASKRPIDDDE